MSIDLARNSPDNEGASLQDVSARGNRLINDKFSVSFFQHSEISYLHAFSTMPFSQAYIKRKRATSYTKIFFIKVVVKSGQRLSPQDVHR